VNSYDLYIINPLTGGIARTHQFIAPNKLSAMWISEGLRHSRPMELWRGTIKIRTWEMISEPPDTAADEEMQVSHVTVSSH
jgi:hypothetical protein